MDKVLLDRLTADFPEVEFGYGKKFLFRSPNKIMLGPEEPHDSLLLLHELGHFLCGHCNFYTEPERIKMERAAWVKAKELCRNYGVEYDDEVVEGELDTYRSYLDQRSRCPKCGLTRYQTRDGVFHCPKCENDI